MEKCEASKFDNGFIDMSRKSIGNKSKCREMVLDQTLKCLPMKGNRQQSEMVSYIMGENMNKSYIW